MLVAQHELLDPRRALAPERGLLDQAVHHLAVGALLIVAAHVTERAAEARQALPRGDRDPGVVRVLHRICGERAAHVPHEGLAHRTRGASRGDHVLLHHGAVRPAHQRPIQGCGGLDLVVHDPPHPRYGRGVVPSGDGGDQSAKGQGEFGLRGRAPGAAGGARVRAHHEVHPGDRIERVTPPDEHPEAPWRGLAVTLQGHRVHHPLGHHQVHRALGQPGLQPSGDLPVARRVRAVVVHPHELGAVAQRAGVGRQLREQGVREEAVVRFPVRQHEAKGEGAQRQEL